MGKRATVFFVLATGWTIACGSDPPPAASSPSSPSSAASSGPQDGAAPTSQPAQSGQAAQVDIVGCFGKADPQQANDACRSCMATNCAGAIQAIGASCADFTRCICSGGSSLLQCAATLMSSPGCTQASQSVNTCRQTSCDAQCGKRSPPAAAPATGPQPAPAPGTADSCPALAGCCTQLPQVLQTGCNTIVGMKNPNGCAAMLSAMQRQNACH